MPKTKILDSQIESVVRANPHDKIQELAHRLNVSYGTLSKRLQRLIGAGRLKRPFVFTQDMQGNKRRYLILISTSPRGDRIRYVRLLRFKNRTG